MRIVSLNPFLTETVVSLGLGKSLVAVSPGCSRPEDNQECQVVPFDADVLRLKGLDPDVVLVKGSEGLPKLEERLSNLAGHQVLVRAFDPARLDQIYEMYEGLGRTLGVAQKGVEVSQRTKAQIMDWCDNFYDRMRNKKVTFLSAINPFRLAGLWIPDMIEMASCLSQHAKPGEPAREVSWEEIKTYRPDVMIIAPQGFGLKQSMQTFKMFESIPDWESFPATKRGAVFFCDGIEHFYSASPNSVMNSASILVSALAGLDSGYISKRDSFQRLRWIELQRHKLDAK
jgi:iron complex transport system substrate-binding protein